MTPEEWTAVRLSLLVATTATLASLPFGIAVAWLLARGRFWGKSLLDTLVHLPLILPPVVTGYLLLISFGKRGPIGAFLADTFGERKHGKRSERFAGNDTPAVQDSRQLRAGREHADRQRFQKTALLAFRNDGRSR